MRGCLTPPLAGYSGLGTIQPQIRTEGGWVFFWNGILKPSAEQREKGYKLLDREPSKVFPIHFTSDVELLGGPVTGVLNAFLYMDLANNEVREIR